MLKSECRGAPSTICCSVHLKWHLSFVQTDPRPFQSVVTKVKLLPTVLHVHLLHANKGKNKVDNVQHRTTWKELRNNTAVEQWVLPGLRYVWHCSLCFLCLPLPSRWTVTSQDSCSRSTSPTSAFKSAPTCWTTATSWQREDPQITKR